MALSLTDIIRLLQHHVDAADHFVFVDGAQNGVCTHADFHMSVSWSRIEFPVNYAYMEGDKEVTLASRPSGKGLAAGGREQVKVNGEVKANGDVIVGADDDTDFPGLHVEFRWAEGETKHSVKFVAPLSKFKS